MDDKPVSVRLLALPESTPTALYGLYEVFSSVGITWTELTGERSGSPRMMTQIVAASAEPFRSPVGLTITPHAAISDDDACDVVIVTDLSLPPGFEPHGRWAKEVAWVKARYAQGPFICSVCTGSIFLAETGLLDGQEAATHWSACDMLRSNYPSVKVRPERILCPSGPEHRLITGGGASSWEDLATYLIAQLCGPEEAVRIAKIFVFGDRHDGQLPYSAMGRHRAHEDAVIATCQEWIAEHYAIANPVARMVARSGLHERTFKRRFKAATGYSPVDYVQALRIEEAKQILETTDELTEAVARIVGYEDPAFFRRLFKRRTGVSPARYRQRFKLIGMRSRETGSPPAGWRAMTRRAG